MSKKSQKSSENNSELLIFIFWVSPSHIEVAGENEDWNALAKHEDGVAADDAVDKG